MGRASNRTAATGRFDTAFGARRGDTALGEILTGRDTPTVRAQIAELAARGDIDTTLRVLREMRETAFTDDLYLPLREAVVAAAAQPIPDPEWCLAGLSFLSMIDFEPEGCQYSCEDPSAAFLSALGSYSQDKYVRAASEAMHKDLRRGISHLSTKRQVQEWLTSNGVQSALMDFALDRLHGDEGEQLLVRLLDEATYERWREQLAPLGVEKVQDALDDDELWDRMHKLLPYGPGAYLAPHDDMSDMKWAYNGSVARGCTRLQSEAQLRQATHERETIGLPTLAHRS